MFVAIARMNPFFETRWLNKSLHLTRSFGRHWYLFSPSIFTINGHTVNFVSSGRMLQVTVRSISTCCISPSGRAAEERKRALTLFL